MALHDAFSVEGNRTTAIAHTLPLRREPYIAERGKHPFFENRLIVDTHSVYQQTLAKVAKV